MLPRTGVDTKRCVHPSVSWTRQYRGGFLPSSEHSAHGCRGVLRSERGARTPSDVLRSERSAQTPAAYCRADTVRAAATRRIVDSALAAGAACTHAPDGACIFGCRRLALTA